MEVDTQTSVNLAKSKVELNTKNVENTASIEKDAVSSTNQTDTVILSEESKNLNNDDMATAFKGGGIIRR